ncbi:MAG: family 43 glycosylhydrolase [Actinocatenispora sp.]
MTATARVVRALAATLVTAAAVATGLSTEPAAAATPPLPVYAPHGTGGQPGEAADPGVVLDGGDFVAYSTGTLAPTARGDFASGPWTSAGPSLTRLGAWSSGGGVWAPDAVHTSAGWVLYYAAAATGMGGQRCIGIATSSTATGSFTPSDTPLVCPNAALGADDTVPGRPVAGAGVIDPSPFQADDGTLYLLYKTQQTPSSLRMLTLRADGTRAGSGAVSKELIQDSGIVENPVMVQRGSHFVLLASRYGYDNCSYATQWWRSSSRWTFDAGASHSLMTTTDTGICGPGGADLVPALDGGTRIFLHGWLCDLSTGAKACTSSTITDHTHHRAMYVGVLGWGSDGATPQVSKFLNPGD